MQHGKHSQHLRNGLAGLPCRGFDGRQGILLDTDGSWILQTSVAEEFFSKRGQVCAAKFCTRYHLRRPCSFSSQNGAFPDQRHQCGNACHVSGDHHWTPSAGPWWQQSPNCGYSETGWQRLTKPSGESNLTVFINLKLTFFAWDL